MFHPGKSQGMDRSHKNDSRTSLGKQLLLLSVPRDVPKAADSDLEFSRTFWSWGNSAWILFSLARDGFYCLQDALMCSMWSFLVLKKKQKTNPTLDVLGCNFQHFTSSLVLIEVVFCKISCSFSALRWR